jgi:hypothetical protein
MRPFSRRLLILMPLAMALPYACSDEPVDEESELPAGYTDVVYEDHVTDEALVSLVAALDQKPPADVPSQAATLDTPAADAMLPKTPIPTFTWHIGAVTELRPRAPELLPSTSLERWYRPIFELLGPERAARAHGTPFTGTATWLVFSTASAPKLARVLTSLSSYTPSQAVWDRMVAAGAPITVTLVSAIFADNRIEMDGGPYQGSKTTFTITP